VSVVYFIACDRLGVVKIGFSRGDPRKRLSALQVGCPLPLRLVGAVEATPADEARFHESFATLRLVGEWFRVSGKLQDLLFYIENGRVLNLWPVVNDVLFEGMRHPRNPMQQEDYDRSGDWRPFSHMDFA
jgi:hypothetical protein